MGEVIQFLPKPDPDREARMLERMKQDARLIYEAIFPPSYRDQDTAPSEITIYESSLGYVAPENDSA